MCKLVGIKVLIFAHTNVSSMYAFRKEAFVCNDKTRYARRHATRLVKLARVFVRVGPGMSDSLKITMDPCAQMCLDKSTPRRRVSAAIGAGDYRRH